MAVKIPIVTVFDGKGLKQAQYQLKKVQGNFQNLGRNFAIAGAAIGAVGVALGKSVGQASDLAESVNAVNVAFGKSAKGILDFGKTASTAMGVSQVDFNNAAVRFSAFADRIVGAGNDSSKFIAEVSTRASDFASVFNIEVAEALGVFQSGLAGEAEPLKRFGINLLDSEVKAFAAANGIGELGRQLTETEKVQARYGLLMQATNKVAGDFANTSDGLANKTRIVKAQFQDLQAEIGTILLPAIESILPVIQKVIEEMGPKLSEALKSVDWQSLATSISNAITFLVENAETIGKVVISMWALNTAYNAGRVAIGLYNAAAVILNNTFTITAGNIALTTGALRLFRLALLGTGIGAIVVLLGAIAENMANIKQKTDLTTDSVNTYKNAVSGVPSYTGSSFTTHRAQITGVRDSWEKAAQAKNNYLGINNESFGPNTPWATAAGAFIPKALGTNLGGIGGSGSGAAKAAKKAGASVAKSFSEGMEPLIDPDTGKLVDPSKPWQRERYLQLRAIEREEEKVLRAQEERRKKEKEILEKRKQALESFSDGIRSAFSGIRDSILGAFDITQMGDSTKAILTNIRKLIDQTRKFATNISQLSKLGLNEVLLKQVVTAGPVAGAALAEALVKGGAEALQEINLGYSEFGGLSSQIAATQVMATAQAPVQQSIYNIEVKGGVASSAEIGKSVIDAIKAYERANGRVFQGA
jgi:hypothetical protein